MATRPYCTDKGPRQGSMKGRAPEADREWRFESDRAPYRLKRPNHSLRSGVGFSIGPNRGHCHCEPKQILQLGLTDRRGRRRFLRRLRGRDRRLISLLNQVVPQERNSCNHEQDCIGEGRFEANLEEVDQ